MLFFYDYLIDATKEGSFIKAKAETKLKILDSSDISALEKELGMLIKEVMPCYTDSLCYLVSTDENGKRYLSVFNNEGNERSLKKGDIIHREADKKIKITFKEPVSVRIIKEGAGKIKLEKENDFTYFATVPAAGFMILSF